MNIRLQQLRRNPYAVFGIFSVVVVGVALSTKLQFLLIPQSLHFYWQIATGTALASVVCYQWYLLRIRWVGTVNRSDLTKHRWAGVLATFLFALHATRIGHTWMLVTTGIFVLVALTGIFNKEIMRFQARWAYYFWLTLHIGLSVILGPLIAVHIWVALAYQ